MEKRVNQFFGQGGGVFWPKIVNMDINVFVRLSDIRKVRPRQILVLCPLPIKSDFFIGTKTEYEIETMEIFCSR